MKRSLLFPTWGGKVGVSTNNKEKRQMRNIMEAMQGGRGGDQEELPRRILEAVLTILLTTLATRLAVMLVDRILGEPKGGR